MLPYTARFDAEGRLSPASMVWLPLRDTVLPSTTCEEARTFERKAISCHTADPPYWPKD
jgi:hypothetical protein